MSTPDYPNIKRAIQLLSEAFVKDGIPIAGVTVAAIPYSDYVQRTDINVWLGVQIARGAGVMREGVPRVDLERALLEQVREAIDERIKLLSKESQ